MAWGGEEARGGRGKILFRLALRSWDTIGT